MVVTRQCQRAESETRHGHHRNFLHPFAEIIYQCAQYGRENPVVADPDTHDIYCFCGFDCLYRPADEPPAGRALIAQSPKELEGSMGRAPQFEPSAGSLSLEKMVGGVAGANLFARITACMRINSPLQGQPGGLRKNNIFF